MLNDSQLFTFIDKDRKFALYFLEGQKLIHDLVLTHRLREAGISYFRSAVLSIQLMLGLLKQGEHFCFYIDSETPYFRLKIEMNAAGLMRGMLYPNELPILARCPSRDKYDSSSFSHIRKDPINPLWKCGMSMKTKSSTMCWPNPIKSTVGLVFPVKVIRVSCCTNYLWQTKKIHQTLHKLITCVMHPYKKSWQKGYRTMYASGKNLKTSDSSTWPINPYNSNVDAHKNRWSTTSKNLPTTERQKYSHLEKMRLRWCVNIAR